MNIKAVTISLKYILKPLAIANVRQYYSWCPKINSKLFFFNVIRHQLQLQYNRFESDINYN
jgi:hypothetical protein